ncbi:MAG TPA: N-acetyltransferase [Gaiellaceae bacterium]|nr:N-acetyltransferase [Gaiellaceae bacterium]
MIDGILEVHRRAFVHDERVPGLVRELFAGGYTVLSFTEEFDGRVVGHVMCSWSSIEGSDARLLQLSPLGVLPEFQGRGHGSALVRRTIDAVRAMGEPALLVEGNPNYYGRFGFVRADELGLLPPPEALYDWAFQVAVFDRDRLPQGRVRYAAPFAH